MMMSRAVRTCQRVGWYECVSGGFVYSYVQSFTHLRVASNTVGEEGPVVARWPRTTDSDDEEGYDSEDCHQPIASIVNAQLGSVLGDSTEEGKDSDL